MAALLGSLLIIATVTNGMLAGVFFAFTSAVSPALRRVDDATFVYTFQTINRAILNGRFLLVFVVAPLSATAAGAFSLWESGGHLNVLLGVGAAGSLATFIITAAKNVPLNNKLDDVASCQTAELSVARAAFEPPWNRWNLARTLTSFIAFACFVVADHLGSSFFV